MWNAARPLPSLFSSQGDPLGSCHMSPEGYAELTRGLMGLADGKLVVALEGGYSLSATAVSQSAHAKASAQ